METVIGLILAIFWCLLLGLIGNIILLKIVPDKYSENFFKIFPFMPKKKYSIPMYIMAGIYYFIVSVYFEVREPVIKIFVLIVCVLVSAQIARLIALLLNDNLEETQEEEMERKRNM